LASRLFNLARQSVASAPGTGNITLGAAVPGFLTMSSAGVVNGAVVRYGAKDGNAREVGYATYAAGAFGSLTGRVVETSTTGAILNLSANAIISILPSATDFGSIAPQCGKLAVVNATGLSFKPYHGNKIKIAGKLYEIPSAGIPGLGNTGIYINGNPGQNLLAGGIYMVSAFVNAGVVTGHFSTDVTHAPSTTVDNEGVEYNIGMGQGYTVIGLARMNASAQFDNMTTVSWFNRRFKEFHAAQGNLNTSSTTTVDMTAANACVHWGDEPYWVAWSGQGTTSHSPSGFANIDIGLDGAATGISTYVYYLAGASFPVNLAGWVVGAGEGNHMITGRGGASSGGGTFTFNNTVLGYGTFG
jgi:hypothetical protein